MIQLTQKERTLLEEGKKQEETCIKKYTLSAGQAQDKELSRLFTSLAGQEQHHLDMLNQLLQGQAPQMAHGQGSSGGQAGGQMQGQGQKNAQAQSGGTAQTQGQSGGQMKGNQQSQAQSGGAQGQGDAQAYNEQDAFLCHDLLSTEKFVSGLYDTSVFEAANPAVRQALQHIQQDEQDHGMQLFTYMKSHGMYQVQ